MIIEQRIYQLYVHTSFAEFCRIFETEGLPIKTAILGGFLGFFSTEIGAQNEVIQLWGFKDLEDRHIRRAKLFADPGWKAVLMKIWPMIQRSENKILAPTAFSPIRTLADAPA
jgi:hypothetical protein